MPWYQGKHTLSPFLNSSILLTQLSENYFSETILRTDPYQDPHQPYAQQLLHSQISGKQILHSRCECSHPGNNRIFSVPISSGRYYSTLSFYLNLFTFTFRIRFFSSQIRMAFSQSLCSKTSVPILSEKYSQPLSMQRSQQLVNFTLIT